MTSVPAFGSIRLYQLAQSHDTTLPNTGHLATLHLPTLIPTVRASMIFTNAGPIETYPSPRFPFSVDNDARLHVLTIDYMTMGLGDEMTTANLYVQQSIFIKYILRSTKPKNGPLDVPWEEWGPAHTALLFPGYSLDQWGFGYVHGQKVLSPVNDASPVESTPDFFEVYDFSLAALSPDGANPELESNGVLMPLRKINAS